MLKIVFFLKAVILSAAVALLLSGCEADNEYNISYQCRFTFDTQLHNTTLLRNALNPMAPGIYALVSCAPVGGVRTVHIELNDGKNAEDIAITTARENYTTWVLGTNNAIIVGYSSLGNGLYAFDRQCPNCIADYNLYKYPLVWANNGQWLQCGKCHRKYDLNNNGYIVEGDKGSKLIRYRANYDGTMLSVFN